MVLLESMTPTIPSHWYYDEQHYQHELDTIWYQDWICVGREESIGQVGDYFTTQIGTQTIIVTRTQSGVRAFHNTCRHRGAKLCTEQNGRFRNQRIICPYHTWTYGLDGRLLNTPFRLGDDDLHSDAYALYDVSVDTWRGYLFVSLAENPSVTLLEQFGDEPEHLRNWPLENMTSVHRVTKTINSNWKIYWENYSECYHCPRIHPELCKVMPSYKHGSFDWRELDGWTREDDGDAETWAPDGKSTLPPIAGLSADNLAEIVTFCELRGKMYFAAHRDYVRSVYLVPRGPEKVELTIDWLLPTETADVPAKDLKGIIDFSHQVVIEDGEMCELNQQGVRSARHKNGMLVGQEYDILDFHNWLRARLGVPAP